MANDDEDAVRLKALWKSGRDKYRSFYVVLRDVRKRVGDDELRTWCFDNLRIGLDAIIATAKVLEKADAMQAARDLKTANGIREKQHLLAEEVQDLRAQLSEMTARALAAERKLTEAPAAPEMPPTPNGSSKPRRDRREYMREYMRQKRASQ